MDSFYGKLESRSSILLSSITFNQEGSVQVSAVAVTLNSIKNIQINVTLHTPFNHSPKVG
jgi:hypothetical protein